MKMKICFIGPANSAHIVKWCRWFTEKGHEVHVISFTPGSIEDVRVHLIDLGVNPEGSDLGKLKYLLTGRRIRKLAEQIRPDVVNVHYATSYGAALALSGMKGYILSVWGSDVYDFPKKTPLHRALLKFSLKKAAHLFSTSRAMAEEAGRYTDKPFDITPFGVDMRLFQPGKRTRRADDGSFVIGTVKSLSDKYGIRYILEAAAEIRRGGEIPLRLRIAGKGPREQEYRRLADQLGIGDITDWLGFISQQQAAEEWANMDAAIIPSNQESFGVSAVEAQACGVPVIISDIPGLMEATKPGETSIVVPRGDAHAIAEALRSLYAHPDKRIGMGEKGIAYVAEHYELHRCFERIEALFRQYAQG